MDYQTTPPMMPIKEPASMKPWYIGGAAAVVVLAALGWYYFGSQAPVASTQPSAAETTQAAPLTSGNTTADIQTDLNNTPNDSVMLNQDAAASAKAIQSF